MAPWTGRRPSRATSAPAYPGHALVAAAGNSGSIVDVQDHQSVRVSPTQTMRVPIPMVAVDGGGVQVWVAMHPGSELQVGLDGPDGTWLAPVGTGQSAGKTTSAYTAGVYNGSGSGADPVPAGALGAVVIWQGNLPAGTYAITLTGTGSAELYLEGTGRLSADGSVGFSFGVRESTVYVPATQPSIIGVGCTINKAEWVSVAGWSSCWPCRISTRPAGCRRRPDGARAMPSAASPAGSRAPDPR